MTLYCAAGCKRVDVANILLESGVNINQQDRDGYIPLMTAVFESHNDVMEVLLHHGADPSIVDMVGRTAVDLAHLFNSEKAIRLR